jgi:hypothetical protein
MVNSFPATPWIFNGPTHKDEAGAIGLLSIMVILFILAALAAVLVVSHIQPWTKTLEPEMRL